MRPLTHVGIVGGGQLGRMMIYRAKKLGMRVSVLDASADAPAAALADRFVEGDLYDPAAIRRLAEGCDVVTYEIEHLAVDAVEEVAAGGTAVHPSPKVLRTIQDKLRQKETLQAAGVTVPSFAPLETGEPADLRRRILEYGLPCVQKARTGGYDGRGVVVLRNEEELDALIAGSTMVEEYVEVADELAIIIARDLRGATVAYPAVKMRFRPNENVLEWLEAPAELDDELRARAQAEAVRAVEALGGCGVFAVELLVDHSGRVLVNEIAPRPHNSGHVTIETCVTDQFEQHLRAIAGLPLGSTRLLSPAVMVNLLGAPGSRGAPRIAGLDELLALPGASFHWYGKAESRPFRKMGHVTVLGESLEEARQVARRVQRTISITGEEIDGA